MNILTTESEYSPLTKSESTGDIGSGGVGILDSHGVVCDDGHHSNTTGPYDCLQAGNCDVSVDVRPSLPRLAKHLWTHTIRGTRMKECYGSA